MESRTFIIENEEQKARLARVFERLDDYPLAVTVGDYIPKRSNAQNARLWKLHGLASAATGYSPEEMHEEALCHHFGYDEREVRSLLTGRVERKRVPLKRSSQRNTKEFARFMEVTEDWYAAELGIWLNKDD